MQARGEEALHSNHDLSAEPSLAHDSVCMNVPLLWRQGRGTSTIISSSSALRAGAVLTDLGNLAGTCQDTMILSARITDGVREDRHS